MYDPQLEKLVDMALEDGIITEKEKDILVKRAKSLGIDLDEFEMYLDSRLASLSNTQNTTTSQKKLGDLLKCPSCGAGVPSLTIICKDCGFEFRNVSAISSIKELSEKLGKATRTHSKSIDENSGSSEAEEACFQILDSFPIPNTKDDLMEFALYLAPKIKSDSLYMPTESRVTFLESQNELYITKFKQIILKTKNICRDDPSFKDSIINLIENRKIRTRTGFFIPWTFLLAFFGSLIICVTLDNYFRHYQEDPVDIRAKIIACVFGATIIFLGFKYSSKSVNWNE